MLPFLHIGSFYLPTYGLLVASAFLLALWIVARLSRRAGIDGDAAVNLGIYSAFAGIAGAKLLMIALDFDYYSQNPLELLSLTTLQAGGIFFGGLVAALVVAMLYVRHKRLPGLATSDVFAPAIAAGHAIGRLGCFAAGCCWGAPSHGRFSVTFTNPDANRLFGTPLRIPLYPTQLMEAAAEAIIFAVLYLRFLRPHKPGAVIGLYLVLYPAARFAVEFVRAHDQANPYIGPFVAEQWIALALIALGVWMMRRARAATVENAVAPVTAETQRKRRAR